MENPDDLLNATTPVPPWLRENLERHRVNLARLISSLRKAGVDDATIEASVNVVVESHRLELMGALKALAADPSWQVRP